MTDTNSISGFWNWTSPAWIVALIGLALYWRLFGRPDRRRMWPLLFATLAFVAVFVTPVGKLADGYLFSAHIVQHLMLLLLVPMCLLLSLPGDRVGFLLKREPLRRLPAVRFFPLIGWICGLGAMWFWHVPDLCSLSAQNLSVGRLRDTTFVLAGLMFWWPIYSPLAQQRLEPLQGVGYLFSACLGCTLLGIYITFTTVSVCPVFANPANQLTWLRDMGLTPAVDQQLGGLLMWVPPCTLYICAILSILRRWYSAPDEIPRQTDRKVAGAIAMESSA